MRYPPLALDVPVEVIFRPMQVSFQNKRSDDWRRPTQLYEAPFGFLQPSYTVHHRLQ